MRGRTVDLAAVRASRLRLAEIAREHPELTGPSSPENAAGWAAELAELENNAMVRPKSHGEPLLQVAVRLPESVIERIDAYVEKRRASLPGVQLTRADAIRFLLLRALELADVENGEPQRKNPRAK